MAYMCLACSEIYDNYFDDCPKARCNGNADDGEIIYVEDMFAPILAEFNHKGYEIEDARFGNPNNNMYGNPFIVFDDYFCDYLDEDEVDNLFIDLPCPWEFNIKDDKPTISCFISGHNLIEQFKKLLFAHLKLAYFVEHLDELHV